MGKKNGIKKINVPKKNIREINTNIETENWCPIPIPFNLSKLGLNI